MVIFFYISLVCYMPILEKYLPATNFGPGIPDIGPVRLFSYLLILSFLLRLMIKKELSLHLKWTGNLFFLLSIIVISVSWSNYSYSTFILQEIFNSVVVPIAVVIIGLNIFKEEKLKEQFIKHLLIATFILSFISIAQMVVGNSIVFGIARSTGTLGNPNLLSIFIVLTIPCLLYATNNQLISKKSGLLIAAVFIGGIICTVSRKGVATSFIAFSIYYYFAGQKKKIVILMGIAIILSFIFSAYSAISGRFTIELLSEQFTGKWNMTYAGLQMFSKEPIIGLGYKGYYENFGRYFSLSTLDKYDAHNIFITALANYGLIGFIPFMLIFLYPLSVAWRCATNRETLNPPPPKKALSILCIASIIPFMLNGWFAGGLFYSPVVMVLLYTNIALFISSVEK